MTKGLVSIIIPTFNRAHIIGETLDSVIAQSYASWECILVDDGSTDNSEELIQQYIQNDSRFKFYKRPKTKAKGANACRNYGFKKSKGEFVNWFDSDDIMHPDFIKDKLACLIDDVALEFCACLGRKFVKGISIDALTIKPQVLNSNNYLEDYLLKGLFFYTPSPLWRKRFLASKILFDEKMQRAQESDFHFRMLTHKPKYKYIDNPLFYIRVGGDSITEGASQSFEKQESVFKYFNTVFNHFTSHRNEKNAKKLMQYVFYRQAVNYYNLNLLQKNFKGRCSIFFKYSSYLVRYVLKGEGINQHLFKIITGIITVLFLKKGYKLFYFPQYNFREGDKN
jgi:glycosyltransferase involved in cell wall biosynthesis